MFALKKKTLFTVLTAGLVLCTACGAKSETDANIVEDSGKSADLTDGRTLLMEGTIEVEENLPDRDILVPDYLRGEDDESVNQEEPDSGESGDETARHLSGEEQAEKARQVAEQIEDSINQVLRDKEYYPNVTGISVNPECTEFNVAFSDRNLSLYENVLHMSLCIVGDRFQLYQGKQENELMTVVNYIDAVSGEIFNTITSKEIE